MDKKRLIELVPVSNLTTEKQFDLLKLRNRKESREWMYTDHLISANEHLQWINSLKNDESKLTLAIQESGNVLGMFNIYNIDSRHKTCEWGWYIDSNHTGGGLGTAIEFSCIEFIFNKLGMRKQSVEVIEGNDLVVSLHKKFLFVEEGYRRSQIIKNGKRKGYFELGLLKKDWMKNSKELKKKLKNLKYFNIKIIWDGKDSKKNSLDQIEMIRAKNNLNWMSILRIAVEKSPETSKSIIKEIQKFDRKISSLTGKIFDS